MTTEVRDDRETTTPRAPERPPAGDRVVASVSHVVLGFWSLLVIIPLLWTLLFAAVVFLVNRFAGRKAS